MTDIIVSLVIVMILGASIGKYISEKRKGVKCVGCPMSGATQKPVQIELNYLGKK